MAGVWLRVGVLAHMRVLEWRRRHVCGFCAMCTSCSARPTRRKMLRAAITVAGAPHAIAPRAEHPSTGALSCVDPRQWWLAVATH